MKWVSCTLLLIISAGVKTNGQHQYFSVTDNHLTKIHQALSCIYNMNFDEANSLIIDLECQLPDYPGIDLLRTYYYIWQYKPLNSFSPEYQQFLYTTDKILTKSTNLLEKNKDDLEAQFFMLSTGKILFSMSMPGRLTPKSELLN